MPPPPPQNFCGLEPPLDWSQSACQLVGGADYGGLDKLNVKMIRTRLSDVCRCRLKELVRKTWWDRENFGLSCEDAQERDQWRLKIRRELANPGLPRKWPLKWRVFVCCY